jgi:hypothetical protein
MPNPPTLGALEETAVPNTAATRNIVRIASITMACGSVMNAEIRGTPQLVALPAATGKTARSRNPPAAAPTSWATT